MFSVRLNKIKVFNNRKDFSGTFNRAGLRFYSHVAGYEGYDEEALSPLSLDNSEGISLETLRSLLQQSSETCPKQFADESSFVLNAGDESVPDELSFDIKFDNELVLDELPPVLTLGDLLNLSCEEQRDLLRRSAVAEMNRLAQSTFLEIKEIRGNQSVLFGDNGLLIHHSDKIPDILNMQIWAMESDEDIRDVLNDIDLILDDETFDAFLNSVRKALALKNPALNTIVGAGVLIAGLVRRKLRVGKNDLVGYWQTILNRAEHYPHGIRDKRNVPDITGNIMVDYTIFGVDKAAKFAD